MATRHILIVDSDEAFLSQAIDALEPYSDSFVVLLATSVEEANAELERLPVSVVLICAQSPDDGQTLELLNILSEKYPEVPFFITSAASQELEDMAKANGAMHFLPKPMDFKDLARKVNAALKKEGDAGILRGVSPGMFLQMIEMEERSCVIRMENEAHDELGVLFFKDGALLDARIRNLSGAEAAYAIFTWDEVSLSIQNGCPPREAVIEQNAQGLLLEAMRRKDETGRHADTGDGTSEELNEYSADLADADLQAGADDSLGGYEALTDEDLEAGEKAEEAPEPAPPSPGEDTLAIVRGRLERMGNRCGLTDMNIDNSMSGFVQSMEAIGSIFDAGELQFAYLDNGDSPDKLIFKGEKVVLAKLKPRCPKTQIVQALF
jgi:DNA-binding response OmpR family regulator